MNNAYSAKISYFFYLNPDVLTTVQALNKSIEDAAINFPSFKRFLSCDIVMYYPCINFCIVFKFRLQYSKQTSAALPLCEFVCTALFQLNYFNYRKYYQSKPCKIHVFLYKGNKNNINGEMLCKGVFFTVRPCKIQDTCYKKYL